MEKIISVQRRILKEKIGGNLTEIPQVITLYKEVQEFYEKGMRIPEDITIMYANDNFGNIRILPEPEERNRAGGFGMYYHFDYVGAPRSYRWANSVPLPKIWDQMRMTYDYGVDRIWIVNVGCLKPHEVATEFFLDMAYDINKWHKDNLSEFARQWAEREFGPEYAADIAGIYLKYTKFNGRRKPEIIAPNTYSLVNYKEAERVLAEFSEIAYKAEEIYNALPDAKKDAFYQLVLYPARGSMNVLKVNVYAGLNNLYARQGRTMANVYADLVKFIFDEEAAATGYYNQKMANGKWRGMMSDAHIGQTQWQTPERNIMPKIEKVAVEPGSEMGVAVEGSEDAKRGDGVITSLPEFSVFTRERQYIEIFNCKQDPFEAVLTADVPWIKMSANKIPVEDQVKVWLDIDWDKAPKGKKVKGNITVSGAGSEIQVAVVAFNPETPTPEELEEYAFMESDGHIAIEAEHYAENVAVGVLGWQKIPDYGRTLSSMVVLRGNGVHPSTSGSRTPGKDAPYLEYKVYIENPNEDIEVAAYIAPSLNVQRDHGLRYAVALDDEPPQVVDTFPKEYDAHHSFPVWAHGVMDNIRINSTWHRVTEPGYHRLRFWMIDPGIVLQRIVIDAGGGKAAVRHSYLGPPESFYKGKKEAAPVKDGYMELLTAYDYARCLAKTTRTGKNHGETSQEEKDVLTASVVPARAVLREKQASLAERLAMLAEANKALKRFKSSLIFMEGYEDLAAKVAEARAVLSLARIGRRHGEHPPEAKEALDAVIAKAEEFLANEKATVRQRRNAMKQIDKQIKAFQKSIVIDPKNRVIYPSDDTFVRGGGNAKNSFGSQARMEVKLDAGQESMTRYAFIRFDFSQYKDIDRAVLRLYAEFIDTLASRKMSLYDVTGLQWTESKLTWETAPLTGGTLITSFEVKSGALGWYEIDLTEAVQRNIKNGEISLRLQVDISHWAGAVFFTSKEGEQNHPELNIFLK